MTSLIVFGICVQMDKMGKGMLSVTHKKTIKENSGLNLRALKIQWNSLQQR